jgi:GNAT superfamily N-acetyltransferase
MHIRPMRKDDAEEVASLSGQLGYSSAPVQIAHRFSLVLACPEQALYVAEDDDVRLAGWIHVYGRVGLAQDPHAEISGLVVDERVRGQGTGRALMAAAERWAVARGYDAMRLHSNVVRDRAHGFYQHLGYEIGKTSYVFHKTLDTGA